MTDRDTPVASSSTPAPITAAQQKPRKRKSKPRRRQPRRREGDESDGGGASDAQNTAPAAPAPAAANPSSATSPLFPGINSRTPIVWADSDPNEVETISFEEFTRGPAESTRSETTRGRGGSTARGGRRGTTAGKAPAHPHATTSPHSTTNDKILSPEERAQLKKERQKAKRKEAKDKQRTANAASTEPSAPAAAPAESDVSSSLVASTSALTLDDTAQTHNRRPSPTADDHPKFTPRVGNFWMHDQRHYDNPTPTDVPFRAPDHWRGRGQPRGMPRGSFRGGPRGRGRGGFGHMAHVPHAPQVQGAPVQSPGGHRMTEMDKLELELAQKDTGSKHTPKPSITSDRWGHEGFEEQTSTEEAFRNNRAVRGRGRGARGGRGGSNARPFVPAHPPTPEPSPDRGLKPEAAATKPAENTTTQSAADMLLNDSGAVTIRLPGESKAVEVEVEPRTPSEAPSAPLSAANPPATAKAATASPRPPVFVPSNPSPDPYVASDSGSVSSGYVPPASVPPVPMAPEFFPQGSFHSGFDPRDYQLYTPELGMQQTAYPAPPQQGQGHQQRASFSAHAAPFYPGGTARPRSGSPLNPYAAGGQVYYMRLRPQTGAKSGRPDGAPRSPTSDATDSTHGHGVEGFAMPAYYYNPYSGIPDHGSIYYPQQAGYWPQTGYDAGTGYGYDGDYHGY